MVGLAAAAAGGLVYDGVMCLIKDEQLQYRFGNVPDSVPVSPASRPLRDNLIIVFVK